MDLLDRLVEDYDVVGFKGVGVGDDGAPTSTVTLTPSRPDAAVVRVTFTGFPCTKVSWRPIRGWTPTRVVVACGRWSKEAFPHRGCDACDEQPDELLDELITMLEAVVGRIQ